MALTLYLTSSDVLETVFVPPKGLQPFFTVKTEYRGPSVYASLKRGTSDSTIATIELGGYDLHATALRWGAHPERVNSIPIDTWLRTRSGHICPAQFEAEGVRYEWREDDTVLLTLHSLASPRATLASYARPRRDKDSRAVVERAKIVIFVAMSDATLRSIILAFICVEGRRSHRDHRRGAEAGQAS